MADVACLPVLTGHKTARERFAGATRTWTCEGMMGDGKALQMGTSHELGQNFAKAFGITFSNTEGTTDYVWQTSWGVSTRLIGALVMGHGDDFGLRLPPALAPAQVVVVVIKEDEAVRAAAESVVGELRAAGHRVRLDDRTETSFGRRSVDWELKGVPVRVEIGPRDLSEGTVTVVTRHRRTKERVALAGVAPAVSAILARVGSELMDEATAARRGADRGGRHVGRGHRGRRQRFCPHPPRCPGDRRGGSPGGARPFGPLPSAARREPGRARRHGVRSDRGGGPVLLRAPDSPPDLEGRPTRRANCYNLSSCPV